MHEFENTTNDLYIEKKLKECSVTFEKLTEYLKKIYQITRSS